MGWVRSMYWREERFGVGFQGEQPKVEVKSTLGIVEQKGTDGMIILKHVFKKLHVFSE